MFEIYQNGNPLGLYVKSNDMEAALRIIINHFVDRGDLFIRNILGEKVIVEVRMEGDYDEEHVSDVIVYQLGC